jgi:hypothetical protein
MQAEAGVLAERTRVILKEHQELLLCRPITAHNEINDGIREDKTNRVHKRTVENGQFS